MNTKIKLILCKLKKRIYYRKFWGFLAILLFLLEIILLVWPFGWLGEEMSSFLTGEGAWALQTSLDNPGYCQEFIPQYANLKSIGIVINEDDISIQGGDMLVTVLDAESKILFEKEISYGQVLSSYMDINMNLHLKAGKSYFLTIYFNENESGSTPSLMVYGSEHYMPENVHLIQPEQPPGGAHLLTRYIYEDAIPIKKILRVLLLCVLAAIGVALGLPENKWVRRGIGILLFLLGPYVLGRRLELLTIDISFLLPFSMQWNIGLMYLYELILLLCTQSIKFSVCFSNLSLTLLYSANFYVYSFRGNHLRLNELTAIRTAARVVNRYNLRPNSHLAAAWCILILFLVYGLQTGVKQKKENSGRRLACHLATCALGILLTVGSGYILLYTDTLVKAGFFNVPGFENKLNYDFDGYLVASFLDIQNSKVTKPEGYSVERVEELLENAGKDIAGQVSEKMPHIILIMNESFSDLRILGNLQISEDNLIFYNSLRDNTIRGYVNASVLGGGTANSEFEVFTGCSMGFLPASYYPYQQCIVKEIPSLISNVKDAGYTTYSLHPEIAENWNRARVYPYLGFDYSLWKEDLQESETLHAGVSDLETYKKVEELFVNRQEGEKLFIFNLTIQNHGGYSDSDVERTVSAANVSSDEADIYLSLIHESDKAIEQLITFFSQEEEPVLICIFGDHQPKLSDDFYESIYRQTPELDESSKRMNLYKTPFIIWANYDIPEQEGLDIGMSYLGALLLDVGEVPCSSYFSFLQQYMEEYPVITINGYVDKEGNHHNWSGNNSELPEYRILQYNYLFD